MTCFASDRGNKIKMNPDIPKIVTDILSNGASLAIVSRNTSKALYVYCRRGDSKDRELNGILNRCDRALYYFHAKDPNSGETKPIIELVRYDEVVDGQCEFLEIKDTHQTSSVYRTKVQPLQANSWVVQVQLSRYGMNICISPECMMRFDFRFFLTTRLQKTSAISVCVQASVMVLP